MVEVRVTEGGCVGGRDEGREKRGASISLVNKRGRGGERERGRGRGRGRVRVSESESELGA